MTSKPTTNKTNPSPPEPGVVIRTSDGEFLYSPAIVLEHFYTYKESNRQNFAITFAPDGLDPPSGTKELWIKFHSFLDRAYDPKKALAHLLQKKNPEELLVELFYKDRTLCVRGPYSLNDTSDSFSVLAIQVHEAYYKEQDEEESAWVDQLFT